jgi:Fe-S-cluster containining protein
MRRSGPTAKLEPLEGDTFRFACRPGLSCFGDCCSDLTLMLLPYDVLRLRRRLALGSEAFLEQHTETLRDAESGVPRVQMKMGDDVGRRCPFLSAEGCTVYDDRPSACRIFPLGRAAAASPIPHVGPGRRAASGVREQFFLVREEVCHGWEEPETWAVDQWLDDQGLRPYLAENDRWLPVFARLPALAKDPHAEQRFSMFHTAAYHLDRFRDLVTGEAFTSRFDLSDDRLTRLRADDEALLGFAREWLAFALFGDQTMTLKTA